MIYRYKIHHWDEIDNQTVKSHGYVSANNYSEAAQTVSDFYGESTIASIQIIWDEDGESGIIEKKRKPAE